MRKSKPSRRSAFVRGAGQQERKRGRPRGVIKKVRLKAKERGELKDMTRRGKMSVRVMKRAQALMLLDGGQRAEDVGKAVGLTERGVHKIWERYREKGLKGAVEEPSRPGRARAIKPRGEAELVAMLCGPSPQGRARWTIRLASEEAQERGICKAGRETIRVFMTERSIKPWREKNVVHRGEDA